MLTNNVPPTSLHHRSAHVSVRSLVVAAAAFSFAATAANADDIIWTGGTDASWATGANWNPATGLTGATDNVIFDATSGNLTTTLDGAVSVNKITVGAVTGAVSIAAGSGGTLTIGAGGIDMSGATQNLMLNNAVGIGASQTWAVGTGVELILNSGGGNQAFNLGGNTLTINDSNTVAIGAVADAATTTDLIGVNITNGTIVVNTGVVRIQGNTSRASTLGAGSTYQINDGALLSLGINSGGMAINSGATFELNGGALNFDGGGTLSGSGYTITGSGSIMAGNSNRTIAGNFTGAGTIDFATSTVNSTSRALTLTGDNSGFAGTFNVTNTAGTTIGASSAGSAAATWSIASGATLTVSADNVQLGTVTNSGTITFASGTNSTITTAGVNSSATLKIDEGASVNVTGALSSGSDGTKTFTINGDLTVGSFKTTNGTKNFSVGDNGSFTVTGLAEFTGGANTTLAGNGAYSFGSYGQTNTTTNVRFSAAGGTTTLDVAGDFKLAGAGGSAMTFTQQGGTVNLNTDSASGIIIGSGSGNAGITNTYALTGGTLNATNAMFNVGNSRAAALNVTGGEANLAGIALNGNTTATFSATGGTVNIGAGGITSGGTGTKTVTLGATTLGASADWSSSLAMTLTDDTTGTTFNTGANTITLSGELSGSGSLTKTGEGTLVLAGANTYAGTTTVTGGTLDITGSILGDVTVSGGKVTGNADITLTSAAEFLFDLDAGTPAIDISGDLDLNGATLKVVGTALDPSTPVTLAVYSDYYNLFDGTTDGGTITSESGQQFIINYNTGNITLTLIPEPSTYALGAAGLLGALVMLRRRRK